MTAALVQSARMTEGQCAVVVFRHKNKPAEISDKVSPNQLDLISDIERRLPPKKLRVEWSLGGPFIPSDKSVPDDSLIHEAWQTGEFTSGTNYLDLGPSARRQFFCENQPFEKDREVWVLSLLSGFSKQGRPGGAAHRDRFDYG